MHIADVFYVSRLFFVYHPASCLGSRGEEASRRSEPAASII